MEMSALGNSVGKGAVLSALEYFASHSPAKLALTCEDERHTYASLYEAAKSIASGISNAGVPPQSAVALQVDRTIDMLPVMLGVWCAGCVYVPVDPAYPVERRRHIVQDSGAELLIVDDASDRVQAAEDYENVDIVLVKDVLAQNDDVAPYSPQASDLAYIIYTSGSTGLPKGVAVSHGNVSNFLDSMSSCPGLVQQDCLLAVTTISFDIHVLELFLPILVGAEIVLATSSEARQANALSALIDRHSVTTLQATPATWRMLGAQKWLPAVSLRRALVGGEALPADILSILHSMAEHVWNMYGPTETTVWSTCAELIEHESTISIGRAIANTDLHIVDEHNNPVLVGQEGELLIGGLGVTQGYHNRPELSHEKFVSLPQLSSGRLYRTGDLVLELPSGDLRYVSRIDNQIKVRGYRVEPGEIEAIIARASTVDECAVVLCEFGPGDMRLVACIRESMDADEVFSMEAIRKSCVDQLPAHMQPQHFIVVDVFPVTNNNKLDRKSLADEALSYCEIALSTQGAVNGTPRNDRDLSVIAVWEQALSARGVGIDDDFFALGGHSLLVLQIVDGMNRAAGLNIVAADVFEHKTIRSLLSNAGTEKQAASVVPLNDIQGKRSAIFCLCGVSIYSELARFCGDFAVFGVFAEQEIALLDAAAHDHSVVVSLPQLVEAYVAAILRQGEFDEVVLLGLSFGGMLAVEVARVLRDHGIVVQRIVFLDSYLDSSARRTIGKTCCDALARVQEVGVKSAGSAFVRRVANRLSKRVVSSSEARITDEVLIKDNLRAQVYSRLARGYQSGLEALKAEYLLVKADNTDFGWGMVSHHDYGWGRVVGNSLSVKSVDADHIGMMSGIAAQQVAAHVNSFLKGSE